MPVSKTHKASGAWLTGKAATCQSEGYNYRNDDCGCDHNASFHDNPFSY